MRRRRFVAALTGAAAAARSAQPDEAPPSSASGGSITDVPGLKVGHFTDPRRPTGCTAILFDEPAAAAVDYDGSAAGETLVVMLQPVSSVERIHAILLSGGGVLSLGAVAGAMRFLEERKIGYDWGSPDVRIPLVKKNLGAGKPHGRADVDDPALRSTTLVVVATNVTYTKPQLAKIAMMANSGGAWTIRPYHTTGDGDQLFAVSTGRLPADVPVSVTGALAAEVVAEAIVRAARTARSVEGWPAAPDLATSARTPGRAGP